MDNRLAKWIYVAQNAPLLMENWDEEAAIIKALRQWDDLQRYMHESRIPLILDNLADFAAQCERAVADGKDNRGH